VGSRYETRLNDDAGKRCLKLAEKKEGASSAIHSGEIPRRKERNCWSLAFGGEEGAGTFVGRTRVNGMREEGDVVLENRGGRKGKARILLIWREAPTLYPLATRCFVGKRKPEVTLTPAISAASRREGGERKRKAVHTFTTRGEAFVSTLTLALREEKEKEEKELYYRFLPSFQRKEKKKKRGGGGEKSCLLVAKKFLNSPP